MPAFVTNGPDIPERLLQAHEEGRVVFFCGAGISYPAGLPNFAGLVTRIYKELGVHPNPIQKSAIKSGQLDTAISLLEMDIVGGRENVRKALAQILIPKSPLETTIRSSLLGESVENLGRRPCRYTSPSHLFFGIGSKGASNVSTSRLLAPMISSNILSKLVVTKRKCPLRQRPSASSASCVLVESGRERFGINICARALRTFSRPPTMSISNKLIAVSS